MINASVPSVLLLLDAVAFLSRLGSSLPSPSLPWISRPPPSPSRRCRSWLPAYSSRPLSLLERFPPAGRLQSGLSQDSGTATSRGLPGLLASPARILHSTFLRRSRRNTTRITKIVVRATVIRLLSCTRQPFKSSFHAGIPWSPFSATVVFSSTRLYEHRTIRSSVRPHPSTVVVPSFRITYFVKFLIAFSTFTLLSGLALSFRTSGKSYLPRVPFILENVVKGKS